MNFRCGRLVLERFLCGELNEAERREVRRHLAECADCSSYVTRLESERTDFLQKHPFSSFTRAHAATVRIPWLVRVMNAVKRPALIPVYASVLVAVALLPLSLRWKSSSVPEVRFKGGQSISFLYRREGTVHEGSAAQTLRPGDQIQIRYPLTAARFVSLSSIDGRGTVSFYHPGTHGSTCSVRSEPGVSVTFPGSIVLDNTPGPELVVVLFSENPLATAEVKEWLSRLFTEKSGLGRLKECLEKGTPPFPAEVATLLLRKE